MAREPTRILVPAYDFPGPADLGETPRDWDVLVDVGKKLRMGGLLVIASPAKGPGWDNTGPNANYEFEIERLRSVCVPVVGYITDCYNDTDVDEGPDPACPRRTTREADIERWFGIYNVHGIFIDEVERDEVAHAIQLVQMVRARRNKALIVLNPGNIPSHSNAQLTLGLYAQAVVSLGAAAAESMAARFQVPGAEQPRDERAMESTEVGSEGQGEGDATP